MGSPAIAADPAVTVCGIGELTFCFCKVRMIRVLCFSFSPLGIVHRVKTDHCSWSWSRVGGEASLGWSSLVGMGEWSAGRFAQEAQVVAPKQIRIPYVFQCKGR